MTQSKIPGFNLNSIVVILLAIQLIVAASARGDEKTVNLESLLNEMGNRQSIARLSEPTFVCLEASSHDRQKTNPADAQTWHTNHDYEQFIRTETNDGRKEWVIMEHQGPGAITRMWLPLLADHDKQIIRFYFNGETVPTIAVPFNQLLSGHGFVKPPMAYVAWNQTDVRDEIGTPDGVHGVGGDLYLPMPFAKSCKITLDELPFYYIINYRAYEPGTNVKTFAMADFEAAKGTIDQVGKELLTEKDEKSIPLLKDGTLNPGEELAMDLPAGEAAVEKILVTLAGQDAHAIRSTVLTASFDDEPCIWCPLSEFFGAGVRAKPMRDRFRAVESNGLLTANWVMPYQKSARVSLKNVGSKPVTVTLGVTTQAWQWDERSMHFHATWHCQLGIHTRPMFDWNYVDVKGKGSYVGDTLTVFSPGADWYGEGDERVYVDGEKFPSHIGTGTEDYYGYAWGMANYFSSPFMSMPRRDFTGQDNWRGYTTTSRVRMLDAIPFQTSLSHNMEIMDGADTQVDYAVGNFWYARPGATNNRDAQPKEAAAAFHEPPLDPRSKRPGAIECETMTMAGHSAGLDIQTQDVSGISSGHWSEGKQLFVKATKIGDFVELKIPVDGKDAQKVTLYLTKSYDYGILHITVNGKSTGADFDGFNQTPVDSGAVELGTFDPVDGALVLRVQVTGTNAAARSPGCFFGLDCVILGKGQ